MSMQRKASLHLTHHSSFVEAKSLIIDGICIQPRKEKSVSKDSSELLCPTRRILLAGWQISSYRKVRKHRLNLALRLSWFLIFSRHPTWPQVEGWLPLDLGSRRQNGMTPDWQEACTMFPERIREPWLIHWPYEFGPAVVRTSGKPNKIELFVLKLRQALDSAGPATCCHGDGQGVYTVSGSRLDVFAA